VDVKLGFISQKLMESILELHGAQSPNGRQYPTTLSCGGIRVPGRKVLINKAAGTISIHGGSPVSVDQQASSYDRDELRKYIRHLVKGDD